MILCLGWHITRVAKCNSLGLKKSNITSKQFQQNHYLLTNLFSCKTWWISHVPVSMYALWLQNVLGWPKEDLLSDIKYITKIRNGLPFIWKLRYFLSATRLPHGQVLALSRGQYHWPDANLCFCITSFDARVTRSLIMRLGP